MSIAGCLVITHNSVFEREWRTLPQCGKIVAWQPNPYHPGGRAVPRIAQVMRSFNQNATPLLDDLQHFLQPFAEVLPDQRFRYSLRQFVPGMLAARSPQVSQAAAHAPNRGTESWYLAKRMYRLLDTPKFNHRAWLKVLYADARRVVQHDPVERILIALDPVNFEQPYAKKLEHLSEVWKSTPPGSLPQRAARITPGYPAIIAQTVNLTQPAIPYAHWFSYVSADFLSENKEIRTQHNSR